MQEHNHTFATQEMHNPFVSRLIILLATLVITRIETGAAASLSGCASLNNGCNTCTTPNNGQFRRMLFFSAATASHGDELYTLAAGTTEIVLHDIAPGAASSFPANISSHYHRAFFSANDGVHGFELFRTDGVSGHTAMVADINIGLADSFPGAFVSYGTGNETLAFAATRGDVGRELFYIPHAADTPFLMQDIYPGPTGSYPAEPTRVWHSAEGDNPSDDDTTFVFAATSPIYGREVFIASQTAGGAQMYADVRAGPDSSDPENLTFLRQGLAFVAASDLATGREFHGIPAPLPLHVLSGDLATIAPLLNDLNTGPADLGEYNIAPSLTPMIGARCCVGNQLTFTGTFRETIINQFGYLSTLVPGSNSVILLQRIGDPPDPVFGADVSRAVYMNRRRYAIANLPSPGTPGTNSTYRRTLMIDSLRPGDSGQYTVQVCEVNFVCTSTTTETSGGPLTIVTCVNEPICHSEVRNYANLAIRQLNPIETFFVNASSLPEIGSITHVEQIQAVEGVGLFVDATSSMYARELWLVRWDETAFSLVEEIVPGPSAGFQDIASMAAMDSRLYFMASVQDSPAPPLGTGAPGSGGAYGLYKSDGITITLASIFASSYAAPGVLKLTTLIDIAPADDDCGRCGGANQDKDACGVCFGTGGLCFPDCFNVPFGTAVRDACGMCYASTSAPGYNSTCRDCHGVPNGGAVRDACGVCFAAPLHEAGVATSNATAMKLYYPCFNTSCADCVGVPNGHAVMDACGVCNGDDTTCTDCSRILYPWLASNRTIVRASNSSIVQIPPVAQQVAPRREETNCANVTVSCGDMFYESKTFLVGIGCRYLNTTLRPADMLVTYVKCNTSIVPASLVVADVTANQCPVNTAALDPRSVYDDIACINVETSRLVSRAIAPNTANATNATDALETVALVHTACATGNATGVCCDSMNNVHIQLSSVIPWAWRPALQHAGALLSFGPSWINCSFLDASVLPDSLYNRSRTASTAPVPGSVFANHTNATLWQFLESACHSWWCPAQTTQRCSFGDRRSTIEFTSAHTVPHTANGTLYCDTTTFQCRVTSHAPRYTITTTGIANVPTVDAIPRTDACGTCGGNNSMCSDCAGVPNGEYIRDECGTCLHPQSPLRGDKCRDCLGVIHGLAQVDICGACLLPTNPVFNRTCPGCDGVMASGLVFDGCYVCGGDGSTCTDCLGVIGGSADIDLCGECRSQLDPLRDISCLGCDNVHLSGKVFDICGVCGGNNGTCTDCFGRRNGTAVLDACGVCFENTTHPLFNTSCPGCDGKVASGLVFDACGVCAGDNSTCYIDCLGIGNGNAVVDACGVCAGDNSTCPFDCLGIAYGAAKIDACGVCAGTNSTCYIDCAGHVLGTARLDACGVCNGNNGTCSDCAGHVFGTARIDACGVCNGVNATCTFDCFGNAYGTARIDACGVCAGDNSTCPIDCAGTPSGLLRYDHCGVCGGTNTTCLGNWCYVIPAPPTGLSAPLPAGTSPWLVFRTLHKALEICHGHIGIRLALTGLSPTIPLDPFGGPVNAEVDSPTGTFILERWPAPTNPATLDTFNLAMLTGGPHVLKSRGSIALHDLRIRGTHAPAPVLTLETGMCSAATRVVTDVASGSSLASPGAAPIALMLSSTITALAPANTSASCAVSTDLSSFEAPIGLVVISRITIQPFLRSLRVTRATCASISGTCVFAVTSGDADVDTLATTACGYGSSRPCIDIVTTGGGVIRMTTVTFGSLFASAPASTPYAVLSRATDFIFNTVSTAVATSSIVFKSAPSVFSDTDTEANTGKLRSIWFANRGVSATLVAKSSSGSTVVGQCQYGCGEPVVTTYASDALFASPTTTFSDTDWIYIRITATADTTRAHLKPVVLYIIGCDGAASVTASAPPVPTYTCAPGVRRIVLFDHQASATMTLVNYPRIQSSRLDPDTFTVKFRANILLSQSTAPVNTKTLIVVYTITDTLHPANIYSTAQSPLSSVILNPTMTHTASDAIVVQCAAGLVPTCPGSTLAFCTATSDTVCVNTTAMPSGDGGGGGVNESESGDETLSGLSDGAITGIVLGSIAGAGLIIGGIVACSRGGSSNGSGKGYARVGGAETGNDDDTANAPVVIVQDQLRHIQTRAHKVPHILL